MRITRLRLSGFKSFVEPADLIVGPGLTGIVGPNGCGKSNLLEAIRWVMGEASARTLRGGAMDDVIFAGTSGRPRRDFAEVTLFAEDVRQESGGIAPLPDGTVEVVRRIERGAGSAYRINGRDARAKDVALLFADAATGAHSPALVSQGRIAAVIAARPTERRQMLEEAAGIAGLHVRRRDAEQKLRATEANLARLAEILADMGGRAQALRRQARAAEKYRTISDSITLAEARTMFARYRRAVTEEDDASAKSLATEEAVRRVQEEQQTTLIAVQSETEALARAHQAVQSLRDAMATAAHALERLNTERRGVERRIADLIAQIQRLDEDEARERTLSGDAVDATNRLSIEQAELTDRHAALIQARPDLSARINAAEQAARDAEVALAQSMTRQAAEQAERRVAEAALTAARQRLDRATQEQQTIERLLESLPDVAPTVLRLNEAEAARQSAQQQADAADAAIAAAERTRVEQAEAQQRTQGALAAARATLAALDAEAIALRKTSQPPAGSNKAIDLVRAAPGYERALAAALGDELSAPIAPQGKLRWSGALADESDPACPEDCVPLADHVVAPEALARALALVVVAQQDDGRTLAAGQKLVTRTGYLRRWDGYVVETSGAAAAEQLIRRNRLDAIAAERPGVVTQVEQAAASLSAAETALRQALADGRQARTDRQAAHEMLRAADRQMDEARSTLTRIAERRADLDRRAAEIADELQAAGTVHINALAAVAALPDGTESATEITRLNAMCAATRRTAGDLRAELSLADQTEREQTARLTTIRAELAGWGARAADAQTRLSAMAERREALAQDLAAQQSRPAQLLTRIGAAQAEVARLTGEAVVAGAAEREVAATLRNTEHRLTACNERLIQAREARAAALAHADHAAQRRIEIGVQCGERFQCPPPVLPERFAFAGDDVRKADAEQRTLDRLVAERERMGPVNLVAAQELAEIEEAQARSTQESAELTQAVHQLRGSVGALNREGRQRLLAAFEAVNTHFQRLFTSLFNGGQAHLALVDSDDPLEAGLEIMAQPPGKRLATLTLLSGGEQALTAVALIFGLFLTNPAPICVLDEVDAPLDDANVERFCDLLDRMAQDTQTRYLIVSHNAVTMSRMHRLFGVTMVEQGISRLVSVDLGGAEALLGEELRGPAMPSLPAPLPVPAPKRKRSAGSPKRPRRAKARTNKDEAP